jgi:TatD DNase family protein
MSVIDTHSHIDLPIFVDDFQEVLNRARQAGVRRQILPGVIASSWPRILQLSQQEQDLFAAIGLHPLYLRHHTAADLHQLHTHALAGKLVAMGEIGLDYFHKDADRRAQQLLFESQLDIAAEADLPLLLHVRKAHDEVQATLRRRRFACGGIVHAFSGSLQQARHYLKLGFLISVCGTVTYDRATRIRKVLASLPLSSLVLETDSPDIPPVAHHGMRNCPEYLPEIVSSLAVLRGESPELILESTTSNVHGLLPQLKGQG